MILDNLARHWWAVLLRGILAVIFGLMALVWPGLTLEVLIIFFGAYALVEGGFNILYAIRNRAFQGWIMHLVEGLVSLIAGLLAFLWPGITALALLYVIAFWAIVTGVMEIVAAWQLRRVIANEFWLGLGGLISLIFGLLAILFPGAGALAIVTLIAAYALIFGLALIGLGWRLRSLRDSSGPA
jgi:uncharacterized membrane protein HdeD (DUF308 family)